MTILLQLEFRFSPENGEFHPHTELSSRPERSVVERSAVSLEGRIAESRGGVAKVAKEAGIERESLYRALSAKGNPRLSTLVAVIKAVGLRLTVEVAN